MEIWSFAAGAAAEGGGAVGGLTSIQCLQSHMPQVKDHQISDRFYICIHGPSPNELESIHYFI